MKTVRKRYKKIVQKFLIETLHMDTEIENQRISSRFPQRAAKRPSSGVLVETEGSIAENPPYD